MDREFELRLKLAMQAWAEAEGRQILRAFEDCPDTMPDELDQKCLALIEAEFARRDAHSPQRTFLRKAGTIAGGDKAFTYPEGEPTMDRSASPLAEFLPEEYALQLLYHYEDGGFMAHYTNENAKDTTFCIRIADGATYFDTEDAIVTEVSILGHKGIMVEKDGFNFYWLDQKAVVMYSLHLDNWEYEEAWAIVESIAACPDWVYLL